MKKVLLSLIVVASLASCKKDRTCVCTFTDGEKEEFPYPKSKKKDAQEACDAWDSLAKMSDGSCELK